MMRRSLVVLVLASSACMPPPVETLDRWLRAYAEGDEATMVSITAPEDRTLLAKGLAAAQTAPTSTVALSLPPRPLEHEIVEIAEKAEGRRVIEAKLTLRNPLPSASERIGQKLPGVPETRTLRRRFLVVRTGADEPWGVKLDLERVIRRANLAAEVLGLIAQGRLTEAEDALAGDFPPPPDDGDYQSQSDRLLDELRRRIDEVRARTSTVAAPSTEGR